MRTISASDAKQGLAGVLEAANKEPVVIRRHSRDVAVVMSMQEYERLTRLNVAEFQRFCDAIGARAADAGITGDPDLLVLHPFRGVDIVTPSDFLRRE